MVRTVNVAVQGGSNLSSLSVTIQIKATEQSYCYAVQGGSKC